MNKINLAQESDSLKDFWQLKNLGYINDHTINLIKLQGEFEWHSHDHEDKLFMVVDGTLELHFRDKVITLHPNECIIVPKGVENKPVGKEEVTLMLFEPNRM
ncbi:cupin domain-containing protein [Myroides odoratimimus]|uniref:cupin domain-containing protein n=1 Tax=Myroides odoratimimus TaxID=76832 RepID=UPI002DBF4698|nr:cupin domain-containing protein [Myroides odoratimimus]MEC4052513.1 cupin domain-containing protein [Myroides odoratimimus]